MLRRKYQTAHSQVRDKMSPPSPSVPFHADINPLDYFFGQIHLLFLEFSPGFRDRLCSRGRHRRILNIQFLDRHLPALDIKSNGVSKWESYDGNYQRKSG